jgi:hypothetical protein
LVSLGAGKGRAAVDFDGCLTGSAATDPHISSIDTKLTTF